MAPQVIEHWANATYPRPRINPEWLDACCAWVAEEQGLDPEVQTPQFTEQVNLQLLQSDLSDSTLPNTGLPPNFRQMDGVRLNGPPILVEVTDLTEIGASAFSLLNTRQTRIDREDLAGLAAAGDENAAAEAEDQGGVPKYTRTMLHVSLSDGTMQIKAIEYKRIPQLELGTTPLGFKVLLKDVLVRRGIAFLAPEHVEVKGYSTEEREFIQDSVFVRGLRQRMHLPIEDLPEARAPLGDIAEPPEADMYGHLQNNVVIPRFDERTADENRHRRIPGGAPSETIMADNVPRKIVHSKRVSQATNAAPAIDASKRQQDQPPSEFDYSFEDEIDDAFLEEITRAEQIALSQEQKPIVIDSDADEKENVPVATRRVRRRVANFGDVVDLSD